ncbi:uncharacterized protein C23H3.12c isoform X1 [Asparagus officinalis]|uniref:uncharacterized protein C23H3.12c isoform X1 n=1 Tax=Asparagus officinalis TaxID=4686 RepID=UPI00098E5C17|nr:uncharacterized protein C23H3.12c isoform X1 [Asparagus officinalis]
MRARLVVFPIKGRNWCFAKSLDSVSSSQSSSSPPKLKDLWRKINADGVSTKQNMETVADFVADKMNRGWVALEKAPQGSIKSKIHSLGVKLLSRVKPTEIFLKSVSENVTKVEITYPASLNPRLVRRRLRHMAIRGSAIHKKNFYGSVTLLPLTSAFSVLPLPNIPFFWILFRAYSNWRAFKGSERLLLLVSDCSKSWSSLVRNGKENDSKDDLKLDSQSPWVLQPSKDLERLIAGKNGDDGLASNTISRICDMYHLEKNDVLKYRD